MALVCKKCGYKQCDQQTIDSLKERFPNIEEHDIPYYCGACQDTASEDELIFMEQEMCKLECPLGGDETNDCADCAYAGDYHFVNGECVRRDNNRFDDFSIEKNDDIDNAAYELLQSLAVNEIDWDMEMIGDVVEFVKEYLEEKHIPVCHPYYDVTTDKDIPCYRSGDCHVEECPMR